MNDKKKCTNNIKERIELHCHSKSGGDATMYAGEIMKYASDIGLFGVAITDRASIISFPEMERVWNTGNYAAKPVFGMEILVEDENGGKPYGISVLVKNEEGKQNLYKIIYNSDNTDDFPVYKKSTLFEYREGLLLGSGTRNGKLYQYENQNASDDEIRSVLENYDYIEVVPGKEHEDFNNRVINLSDEVKKPVVAVSDAHYLEKKDRIAWKVIENWENSENGSDMHLLSTEEMLAVFDFLPEEKAWEIVVENTYRVASECEPLVIAPYERLLPQIDDANERLRTLCYEALNKKYDESSVVKAKERLESELVSIEIMGMTSLLLIEKELLEKAGLQACDISLRNVSCGSIVNYLIGISEVDPLEYGLEKEFIFGPNGDRELFTEFNLPIEDTDQILKILPEVGGVGNVVIAGNSFFEGASKNLALAMIEKYEQDNDKYFDEDVQNQICWKIEGNYTGRCKQSGGVFLIPEGCDHKKLIPCTKTKNGFDKSYYSWLCLDSGFVKMNFYSFEPQIMLKRLSQETGVDISSVPVNDKEVLGLFKPDEQGIVTGCKDVFGFEKENIRDVVSVLKPKSSEELVKVVSIMHGTGAWSGNGEKLLQEKTVGIKDLITSRDDVFECLLSHGIERGDAFRITEAVRKGMVYKGRSPKWPKWKKLLAEAGVPDWFLWSFEQIQYLFPRAYAIALTYITMREGWFKIHYPKAFQKVRSEFELS